jgi:vacuolar protein sorting-associated protein 35
MVFLFSRLKNEGPVKERQKREKERYDLRILIGTNLVRLSQLEGVTLSIYKDVVLPKVIEIVINSNDKIAQQYLMECIIQVCYLYHWIVAFMYMNTNLLLLK